MSGTSESALRQTWPAFDAGLAVEVIAAHADQAGAALPVLHALQAAFGCVPEASIPLVAEALNRSRAEIHGVVSFYHDFRRQPPGRHVLQLCRAEACQAMGAVALGAQAQEALGVGWHGTSADGACTLEPVYCLGLCACGPAALLDGAPLARLDAPRLAAHLDAVRAAA